MTRRLVLAPLIVLALAVPARAQDPAAPEEMPEAGSGTGEPAPAEGTAADEPAPDEPAPDEPAPDEPAPDETAPDETAPDETLPEEASAADEAPAATDEGSADEPVDEGGAMRVDGPEDVGPLDNLHEAGRRRIPVGSTVRTAAELDLLANPTPQARVVATARAGEPLTIAEIRDRWFRVRSPDAWGWVPRDRLFGTVTRAHRAVPEPAAPEPLPREEAPAEATSPAAAAADADRARDAGSAPGRVIGTVSASQLLVAASESWSWLQVRTTSGDTAWVRVERVPAAR